MFDFLRQLRPGLSKQDSFVVEVFVPKTTARPAKVGSGYLVAPHLVLTAWHVVDTAEGTCKVRVLGDFLAKRTAFLEAKPIRPDPELDIALLRVAEATPSLWGRGQQQKIVWGQILGNREIQFSANGFPAAADYTLEDQSPLRDTHRFEARLHPGSGLKEGFVVTLTTGELADPADWAGMSGAALFANARLVGVLKRTLTAGKQNELKAIPIASAVGRDSFRKELGSEIQVEVIDRPSDDLIEVVSRSVCLVNRDTHAGRVATRVATVAKGGEAPPWITLIPGLDDDLHALFVRRLAMRELGQMYEKLDRSVEPEALIPELHWPTEQRIECSAAWRSLINEFASLIGLKSVGHAAELDLAEVRKRLDSGTVPTAFWMQINEARARAGHGALLERWLTFWADLAAIGPSFPAFMLIGLIGSETPPPASDEAFGWLYADAMPDPGPSLREVITDSVRSQRIDVQPPLEKVLRDRIPAWVSILRGESDRNLHDRIEWLGIELTGLLEGEFRMQRFLKALHELRLVAP